MARYDFDFSWDSTYGHAARLVEANASSGVVVDLGCGEGVFAQPVTEMGFEYLGLELDSGSVRRMQAAGIDAHNVDLAQLDTDAVRDQIVELVGGRRVAAVAMLDVIEHLVEPGKVFESLARLVDTLGDPALVMSVPNVTHLDIGAKLLASRWDMTMTGLLDNTHIAFFSEERLRVMSTHAGFREVAANDKCFLLTEQAFPAGHPVIQPCTNLREYLTALRAVADEHGDTYQFVRAYRRVLADSPHGDAYKVAPVDESTDLPEGPFLSVAVRTQGTRSSLVDALTCLAGQTDDDIEVLVLVHNDDSDRVVKVEQLVGEFHQSFSTRVRVIQVVEPGRAAPLNTAIESATGQYLGFLDDDDVVTGDWVAEFRAGAQEYPGRFVRTMCAMQMHETMSASIFEYGPIGVLETPFNKHFEFLEHIKFNQTPICSFAVPLAGVRHFGFRFDPELEVCEDGDFILQVVPVFGVANRVRFTSVYRRFVDGWGSVTGNAEHLWDAKHQHFRQKYGSKPALVPPGWADSVFNLYGTIEHLNRELDIARQHTGGLGPEDAAELQRLRDRVDAMERSRFWRLTAPLRWLTSQRATLSRLRTR